MPSLAPAPGTDPPLALVQTSHYMDGWKARRSAKMVLVVLEDSRYTTKGHTQIKIKSLMKNLHNPL